MANHISPFIRKPSMFFLNTKWLNLALICFCLLGMKGTMKSPWSTMKAIPIQQPHNCQQGQRVGSAITGTTVEQQPAGVAVQEFPPSTISI